MKKFLSVLLSLVLVFSIITPAIFAEDKDTALMTANSVEEAVKLSGDQYPIVFVTGIGQTFSYYIDDASEDVMYLNGKAYNYSTMANLFMLDTEITTIISDIFEDIGSGDASAADVIRALKQVKNNKILQNSFGTVAGGANFVKVLGQIISSISTGIYTVNYNDLCTLAKGLLHDNIIDENGKLPEYIVSSVHECPISEFDVKPDGTEANAFGKGRFYRDIPCREILEEIGEDKVFCYNYASFGSLTNIAAGLDHLINDVILGKDGYFPDAEKVVLIPMSMGAAMVSQYLYNCEQAGKDPHVARVVSIVGCWNGSDIMADLIEKKYVENSVELFYTKWPVIVGNDQTVGTVLNTLWRLFSHDALSKLITDVLSAICDELILKSPSMLALIPSDRYDAIRDKYLTRPGYESVLKELDTYHKVQLGLKDRMAKLNKEYGIEFYFISGYGLNLGGGFEKYDTTKDNYSFFGFLYSSNKVNSDEIIPIQSTAPGTTCVPVGQTFSDEYMKTAESNGTAKYIDPFSQSIDLSTCYYPDHAWVFYQQIHQLDNNNTALRLAFKIANGEISDVNQCKDTYPRFNDSRDLRGINGDLQWVKAAILDVKDTNPVAASIADEAQGYYDKGMAIVNSTINHRDDEEAFAKELKDFRADASRVLSGQAPKEEKEPTFWEANGDNILSTFSKFMYKAFSGYGLPDIVNLFVKSFLKIAETVLTLIAA
ncbi:MAG: hypothetical protein MJ147_00855 [Clostridia bacterium]|nr:hypothetical protein [Clostridia bacterium]